MVVALSDQFFHLGERVFPAVCHMHGDIRNLRPDNDAVFIAQIIELLCVLVMGKAQCIGAKLPDDLHIFRMFFIRERISASLMVLVAAHAAQRITPSVEEETLLWIAGKHAASEAGADLIAAFKARLCGIEIRIVHAVPEMHVFNREFCACMSVL